MVEVFNFESDNTKKSARNVSNHHKGFTLAVSLKPLMSDKNSLTILRSLIFLLQASSSASPVLKIQIMHSCTTHVDLLDAIFVYRTGLHCGHATLVEAAHGTFTKPWSGQYHPMYRQLDAGDSIVNICMPEILHEKMKSTCSFNTSGVPFTGDFKLEDLNKAIQHSIPLRPKPEE